MLYFEWGNKNGSLSSDDLKKYIFSTFENLGPKKKGSGHTTGYYPLSFLCRRDHWIELGIL